MRPSFCATTECNEIFIVSIAAVNENFKIVFPHREVEWGNILGIK